MEHLFEKLAAYGESDVYPYHMPGHKRNICGQMPEAVIRADITEIDGFDNLHAPEEILLTLKERAAALYGSEECFYLVNGSTGGILAAISAALPFGGKLLMARNSHKSVYHAVYLRHLDAAYLQPKQNTQFDFPEAVTPEEVARGLERHPDAKAVLIVSPTYEGRIADVKAIAELVHAKGLPLIVDEAHGAHLGLHSKVAKSSVTLGADLVIQSVHKTLPGMTQTALLHVCGDRIDREILRRFLRIYQTSSPSYILMASIDNALRYVEEQGEKAYSKFADAYAAMRGELSQCRHLHFPEEDAERQDIGKLVISVKDTGMNGKELYRILLEQYHLQLEMASETYALAMFTIGDTPEGYRRMKEALLEIDAKLEDISVEAEAAEEVLQAETENLPLWQAWDLETESLPLDACEGRFSGEFVNCYPPGVPILVPGECVTKEALAKISSALQKGLTVQGLLKKQEKYFLPVLRGE